MDAHPQIVVDIGHLLIAFVGGCITIVGSAAGIAYKLGQWTRGLKDAVTKMDERLEKHEKRLESLEQVSHDHSDPRRGRP
jgi:hypothetical protein